MARIAEAELDRLRASVAVAGLVASDGVVLTRRGADLAGLCPFHADATPSLVVTPGKNLWHCFGCGAGGGPLDWVMRKRGVSFRHAAELLRELAGLPSPDSSLAAASPSPPRTLSSPIPPDEDDVAVLDRVVSYYQACLARSPAALAYLQARGIGDSEMVTTFRLGFADRTLGLRLPDKRRKEGADLRARLERLGGPRRRASVRGHARHGHPCAAPLPAGACPATGRTGCAGAACAAGFARWPAAAAPKVETGRRLAGRGRRSSSAGQ